MWVRFPLPKNLKVDVLVFNGDGDMLNWLHQMKHLFATHETPSGGQGGVLCVLPEG